MRAPGGKRNHRREHKLEKRLTKNFGHRKLESKEQSGGSCKDLETSGHLFSKWGLVKAAVL